MTTSRDAIIARLTSAEAGVKRAPPNYMTGDILREPTEGDLLTLFRERLTTLKGEVIKASDLSEAGTIVHDIVSKFSSVEVVRSDEPLIESMVSSNDHLRVSTNLITAGIENEKFAQYKVGITSADFLIARTGSVVLRSTERSGRRISVLPEVHIVVANRDQLIFSISSWYEQLKEDQTWNYGALITGPSRTADIEKIIVLGAHGPKRLVVIVVG